MMGSIKWLATQRPTDSFANVFGVQHWGLEREGDIFQNLHGGNTAFGYTGPEQKTIILNTYDDVDVNWQKSGSDIGLQSK